MKIKNLVTMILVVSMVIVTTVGTAANIKDHPSVAVMQFGNKAITSQGLRDHDMTMATEYAIVQLVASDWFDVIDYEELSAIAKMHQINMSGMVNQATAVEMGNIIAAKFMFVGNVTGLTSKESGAELGRGSNGGLGFSKYKVTANVVIRAVDIETGRIVAAGMGSGNSSSTGFEIKFPYYRKKRTETTNESEYISYAIDDSRQNYDDRDADSATATDNDNNGEFRYNSGRSKTITNTEVESNYSVKIGSHEVSDTQVRNAIGKAVRDAIYGKMGVLTMLNGGKQLKIKTGF